MLFVTTGSPAEIASNTGGYIVAFTPPPRIQTGSSSRFLEKISFLLHMKIHLRQQILQRDNRVSICVDDQTPQFSFVTIHGTAKIVRQKYNELLKWNTRIAERYMGKSNAKAYGKRNTTEGVILVRVKPTKIIAEKDIAAWE